ncbi:MAG: tetratricopeptide repeat protein [Planctomycetota bacterium]
MAESAADHVLLFGMIAVQVQAITPEQFLEGLKTWTRQKKCKLSELLVEAGALDPSQVEGIETLVAARLLQEGNVGQSLASCDGYESFRQRLAEFQDQDIEATLAYSDAALSTRPGSSSPSPETTETSGGSPPRFDAIRFHDEGGLGRVFEARDRELNRNVALKEIKELFADDIESRQRFVMEAEITGRLEHPGIVPVYGLGHYDDGRPYYAMRFIHGDSLREAIRQFHADAELKGKPDLFELRKLLNRFLDVCHAVHYAHRRGILHRDLKPSNIMLGEYGETLVVDWGLAKPVGEREEFGPTVVEHEEALLPVSGSTIAPTMVGRAVGSPPYMSPEQARGDHEHLGPATDVYSLGATLHTLLTNQTPFAGDSSEEILRQVRRGHVTPPMATHPHTPPALNAICLKAMAAEAADRYESVAELSDDIERYLADEPVSAYREPWRERLFRFGRRHKTLVQSAMIALLIVATVSLGAALRLQYQVAQGQARRAQVEQARNQLTELLLKGTKPSDMSEAELEALDREIESIAKTLQADLLAEAGFATFVSEAFLLEGLYEVAGRYTQKAYDVRREELGPDHEETRNVQLQLAQVHTMRGQYREALEEFKDASGYYERRKGPRHSLTLQAKNNLATLHRYLGQHAAALELLNELIEIRTETLGPDDSKTLDARNNLAMTLRDLGRREESLEILESVLQKRLQDPGKKQPSTLQSMNNVGQLLTELKQTDRALDILEETLELRKEVLGPRHPDTLTTMQNLAAMHARQQQWKRARELYALVTEERERLLGEDHPITLFAALGLAKTTYRDSGVAGTPKMFKRVYEGWKQSYGLAHTRTFDAARRFCLASIEEGQFAEAEPVCREMIEALDGDSLRQAQFNIMLAEIDAGAGRWPQAATHAQAALDQLEGKQRVEPYVAAARAALGAAYLNQGQTAAGEQERREATRLFEQHPPSIAEEFRIP